MEVEVVEVEEAKVRDVVPLRWEQDEDEGEKDAVTERAARRKYVAAPIPISTL